MATAWRAGGYGWDVLEVWIVGQIAPVENVALLCAGSDAACFIDTAGVFTSFPAAVEDIFTIDQTGMVVCEMNMSDQPLTVEANRNFLDTCVLTLLL
jgi:hypothetical protein